MYNFIRYAIEWLLNKLLKESSNGHENNVSCELKMNILESIIISKEEYLL